MFKRIIAILLVLTMVTIPTYAENDKKVGTWMYTWWSETTDYDWIQGGGWYRIC